MTLRRKPKRLAGDNPTLRAAFDLEMRLRMFNLDVATNGASILLDIPRDDRAYADWLREHGIDPETGKMTPHGLAFFEQLLTEQNARNRAERDRRRRAA